MVVPPSTQMSTSETLESPLIVQLSSPPLKRLHILPLHFTHICPPLWASALARGPIISPPPPTDISTSNRTRDNLEGLPQCGLPVLVTLTPSSTFSH